jgi:hypothetical protein
MRTQTSGGEPGPPGNVSFFTHVKVLRGPNLLPPALFLPVSSPKGLSGRDWLPRSL